MPGQYAPVWLRWRRRIHFRRRSGGLRRNCNSRFKGWSSWFRPISYILFSPCTCFRFGLLRRCFRFRLCFHPVLQCGTAKRIHRHLATIGGFGHRKNGLSPFGGNRIIRFFRWWCDRRLLWFRGRFSYRRRRYMRHGRFRLFRIMGCNPSRMRRWFICHDVCGQRRRGLRCFGRKHPESEPDAGDQNAGKKKGRYKPVAHPCIPHPPVNRLPGIDLAGKSGTVEFPGCFFFQFLQGFEYTAQLSTSSAADGDVSEMWGITRDAISLYRIILVIGPTAPSTRTPCFC